MNNFNRGSGGFKSGGNKFGGGARRDGGKRFGGGSRQAGTGEMFKATCSDCGKACEVPFKPNGDKPVFCSDCFGRKQSEGNRGEHRDSRDFRPRQSYEERPVRSEAPRGPVDNGLSDIKRQLVNLEQKLNRILDLINPPQPSAKALRTEIESDVQVAPRAEKKIRQKAEPKKVPSPVELKSAVAKAIATEDKKVVVKKAAKKAPTKVAKVATKKVVTKKAKK